MKIPFKIQSENWKTVKLFPLRANLKGYDTKTLSRDAKAGFNVAMLSFPVNMAYAMVAGLPISYGIFSGIVASIVGLFFSRGVYVTFGPSNATAIMLFSSFASMNILTEAERMASIPVILLLVGLLLIVASIFKLTFLISYISRTVIVAYITVGALLIAANQTKNLLGLTYPENIPAYSLIDMATLAIKYCESAKFWSIAIAIVTFIIFVPIKKFAKKIPAEGITLIIMAGIGWYLLTFHNIDLDCLRSVSVTSWNLSLPDFELIDLRAASLSAVAIALLCTIEAVSIGKSLAATRADRFDTNQEIFAMGVANIACAGTSGTLVSGSLTRSTLTLTSDAQTPIYNLFTTIFTIVILLAFGWAIGYVPKAALALIVVCTSLKLIQISAIKVALQSTKSDAIVFLGTFAVGVISSLDDAIYTGMALSIVLFLRKASSPEVIQYSIGNDGTLEIIRSDLNKQNSSRSEISIVHVEGNMFFGASDVIQNQLRRISGDPHLKILILKLRNAINIDATTVMDLLELGKRMKETGRYLFLCEVRPDVMRILRNSGAYEKLGGKNFIFENDDSNPTMSAALAIRAARKYMDLGHSDVSIYAEGSKEKLNT